jgi:predicted transcriptional regulator
MWDWFKKRARERRARRYLATHSEDEVAAEAILGTLESLSADTARDVAEMVAGRKLTDEQWKRFGPRWQRTWDAVIGPKNSN